MESPVQLRELSEDQPQELLPPSSSVAAPPQVVHLYISHAFSKWTARSYAYAAVLYTATAYPGTLIATSLRTALIHLVMAILSPWVGKWVDKSPNRLQTMTTTILVNKAAIIACTTVWFVMFSQKDFVDNESVFVLPGHGILQPLCFALTIILDMIELLSASANVFSMERDWLVTVAAPTGQRYDLTHLNTVEKRIDLGCDLVAPMITSFLISAFSSIRIGVFLVGLISLIFLPIELMATRGAWNRNKTLHAPKNISHYGDGHDSSNASLMSRIFLYFCSFKTYFSNSACVPSIAFGLLHFDVMTWTGVLITHLLDVGYSANTITIGKTVGVLFQLGANTLTPLGIRRAGKSLSYAPLPVRDDEDEISDTSSDGYYESNLVKVTESEDMTEGQIVIGLQRVGLWGLSWYQASLVPAVLILWTMRRQQSDSIPVQSSTDASSQPSLVETVALFGFLSAARFGRWAFYQTTTQITQMLVVEQERATFAGIESSLFNVIALLGAASTMAFPQPAQFKWLAMASWSIGTVAWMAYAAWVGVRSRRGRLRNWNKLTNWYTDVVKYLLQRRD